MNIIKKLFSFLYKTEWIVKPSHEIKEVFRIDGEPYYAFVNGPDAYYERYMAGLDRISEIEQRIDRKYLDDFMKLMKEYISKGDLYNASIVIRNLEDRRNYVFNQELLYNLASVWYFSKDENCYTYNYEFADQKIQKWKKHPEALAFFLQSPMKEYFPLSDTLKENILNYLKGANLNDLSILKYHLSELSKTSKNEELISTLKLQIQELEELLIPTSNE